MSEPLVSIVIPMYNMGQYVGQTIDWALDSTYPNIEIILVDDGSADDSVEVAKKYAAKDYRISCLVQTNKGVSAARNNGIRHARGKYILPLDADDMITPSYITEAVKVLEDSPQVKVVTSKAEFFGNKTGKWELPAFDITLLARKNLMANCALYRKSDWEIAGGYCEEILGREDWDFWIALLKNGGEVVRLPFVGFKYRIRSNSKRIRTRPLKKELIDIMNKRHPEFFNKYLGGPLRYSRTWSRLLNRINRKLGRLK